MYTHSAEDSSNGRLKEAQTTLKERKMLASNFILARALIEVVHCLKPEALVGELGDKLEEMIFSQLKNFDPYVLSVTMIVIYTAHN